MTDETTRTRDASLVDPQAGGQGAYVGSAVPRLRLLYHVDLQRIGAVSHPDAALEAGEWRNIGRGEPLFATHSPQDRWSPISDPTISRTQLRIRWLREATCFEVEPAPSARRKLHAYRISSGTPGGR